MYAHFYHLTENPFNLTPDPKFHYINESTREAMASILHGIKSRKGFLTLIGEAGTGKTTLLKRIVDEIEGESQVVFVFNPGVSFDELLEFICMELGIQTDSGRRRLQLLDRLNAHLLAQLTAGRNVIVMIDEAQTLEDSVLEELRLLSNLETAKEKILQILLSGQPELEDKLRRPNLRQLRQRIAVRATLKPMRADEIGAYVETRLRSAGADRNDFFTAPALRKVWHASKGIPRVINVVCDNAMMIAFAEGKRRITGSVMNEAVRDLQGHTRPGFVEAVRDWLAVPGVRYAAGALLGLAVVVPLAMSTVPGTGADGVAVSGARTAPAAVAVPPRASEQADEEGGRALTGASVGAPSLAEERRVEIPPAPAQPDTAAVRSPSEERITGTLRDSIRRAEVVARSTAARLYDERRRGVDANAERELGRALSEESEAPAPPTAADKDAESLAIATLKKPVEIEPANQPIEADPATDTKAVASLKAPLRTEEADAFTISEAERLRDAGAASEAGSDDRKPVKAGSLTLEEPDTETEAAAAAVAEGAKQVVAEVASAKPDGLQLEAAAASDAGLETTRPEAATDTTGTPGRVPEETSVASATPPAPDDEGLKTLGPSDDEPLVGQLVRVLPGDTVWDISIAYYGTAGPTTLKRILNSNPRVRDPRRLEVGAHIFLPFQRPDQMVLAGTEGTYRVLLSVSPEAARLVHVRTWVESFVENAQFTTSTVSGAERSYQLHLVGLSSRDTALEFAAQVLERGRSARSLERRKA